MRRCNVSSATRSSRRARWEPRHRWKQLANAMWRLSVRAKSTRVGSGLESRNLPRREQRVEQLAVLGVVLAVEHQGDQRPAGTERDRHDRRRVRIDRMDVTTLGDRHHVLEAGQLHGAVLLGDARAMVDGGDALVGVDHALDECATIAAVVARAAVLRHRGPPRRPLFAGRHSCDRHRARPTLKLHRLVSYGERHRVAASPPSR